MATLVLVPVKPWADSEDVGGWMQTGDSALKNSGIPLGKSLVERSLQDEETKKMP